MKQKNQYHKQQRRRRRFAPERQFGADPDQKAERGGVENIKNAFSQPQKELVKPNPDCSPAPLEIVIILRHHKVKKSFYRFVRGEAKQIGVVV